MNLIKRLFQEEEGQGLTEYAMILAIIVVIGIAVLGILGDDIKGLFTDVETDIKSFNPEPEVSE